jgi:hypothetical protein
MFSLIYGTWGEGHESKRWTIRKGKWVRGGKEERLTWVNRIEVHYMICGNVIMKPITLYI